MVLAANGSNSAAGATMRSAQQSNARTSSTGPRGPTGPSNSQPRSSPAGGGSPGATSRGNTSTSSSSWGGGGGGGNNRTSSTSTTSRIGSAASAQRASAQAAGNMGSKSGPPNAAAAKASAALNAGLGRPTTSPVSRGALNTRSDMGVGGAALGSFMTATEPVVRNYLSSPQVAPNGSYYGPKGGMSLTQPARMAHARQQGYFGPSVSARPGDVNMMAQVMLAESSPIKNVMGGLNTPALQGVGDVIRNRVVSSQFPNTLGEVLTEQNAFEPVLNESYRRYGPQTPNYQMARNLASSILSGETPPVVGGAVNFGNTALIKNYDKASRRTKEAFAAMEADPNSIKFKDARNPNTLQHTFGNLPGSRPVVLAGASPASPSILSRVTSALSSTPPPSPQSNGLPFRGAANSGLPPGYSERYLSPERQASAREPSWHQSTYTGPQVVRSDVAPLTANVPSWQQSTYTGAPVTAGVPVPRPRPPEQNFPVKPYGAKTKAATNFVAGVVPYLGPANAAAALGDMSIGDLVVNQLNRRANLTPQQIEAIRAQNAARRLSQDRASEVRDTSPRPSDRDESPRNEGPSSPDGNQSSSWEADALAYGYSAAQLKDKETRALIKQLWEMGFIPKQDEQEEA